MTHPDREGEVREVAVVRPVGSVEAGEVDAAGRRNRLARRVASQPGPVTDFIPDPSAQAFAGTVTAVEANTVTLEVDRWYTGDANQPGVVVLAAGTDVPVALDGVEFLVGERYLVTTLGGEVLICGISAPASPDLEALYAQWYGS